MVGVHMLSSGTRSCVKAAMKVLAASDAGAMGAGPLANALGSALTIALVLELLVASPAVVAGHAMARCPPSVGPATSCHLARHSGGGLHCYCLNRNKVLARLESLLRFG